MHNYAQYRDLCGRGALALHDIANVEAPFTAIRELADHIEQLAHDETLADICKTYLGQEQTKARQGLYTIAMEIRTYKGDHTGFAAALADAYHRELMKIN